MIYFLKYRKFLADYVQPVYDTVGEPLLAVMEFGQVRKWMLR